MKKTKRNTIELYTEWYLNELKDAGYVLDWQREPETFEIAPKIKYPYMKRFKRKPEEVHQVNLFQDMKYTYDYKVIWNPDARYLFYDLVDSTVWQKGKPIFIANAITEFVGSDDSLGLPLKEVESHVTYLDVKPSQSVVRFGKTSSSITFIYKRRLLWDHYKIYIEKFVPIPMAGSGRSSSRFIQTFTPQRYLLTDGGRVSRKINFPIRNLSGYIIQRREQLKKL